MCVVRVCVHVCVWYVCACLWCVCVCGVCVCACFNNSIASSAFRWNHHGSLVKWQTIGLGCNLCRTFAPSHLSSSASEVCAAANQAEQNKIKKYSYLTSHSFTPVAFETSGVCGPRSISFLTGVTALRTPLVLSFEPCLHPPSPLNDV